MRNLLALLLVLVPVYLIDADSLMTIRSSCVVRAAGNPYITSSGYVEIPLPPGRYVLQANCKGYQESFGLVYVPGSLTFRLKPRKV